MIYSNNVLWLGASLFHVVVETDEISTRIIRYLTSEKGGRVTFMPLNQIRAHNVHYPTGPDVVPLLKKLKYEDQFRPAFAQVKRGLPSQWSISHSGWELGDLAYSSWSAWLASSQVPYCLSLLILDLVHFMHPLLTPLALTVEEVF